MNYGYDKNVDYQKLIDQDLVNQDFRSAAIHEAQRNAKIMGEGVSAQYPTTNHYSAYLPMAEEVNQGMDRLTNFRYDPYSDASYRALRKEYLREADRQTRDTMSRYAGMTGGVPSTAAVSAGQQAGNYQRAQLSDRIPELAQDAFNRELQATQLRENVDEARWDQSQTQQNAAYVREQQALALEREQQQNAINLALQRWQLLGYADAQVAEILGVPVGTLTTDQAYQNWYMNQNGNGAGGAGSGGSGSGSSGTTHGASVGMGGNDGYNHLLGLDEEEPAYGGSMGGGYGGGNGGYAGGNGSNTPGYYPDPNPVPSQNPMNDAGAGNGQTLDNTAYQLLSECQTEAEFNAQVLFLKRLGYDVSGLSWAAWHAIYPN